jgi:hypothetical protein
VKHIRNHKPITGPQAKALAKYRSGQAHNYIALGIRLNIYEALHDKAYIARTSMMVDAITERGREALDKFEARA